jgi:hypothetical protein
LPGFLEQKGLPLLPQPPRSHGLFSSFAYFLFLKATEQAVLTQQHWQSGIFSYFFA